MKSLLFDRVAGLFDRVAGLSARVVGLLDGIAGIGKVAMMVMALSSAAVAAPTGSSGSADFNHITTGFPLSGGHAIADCETCHVGGVFKGTPRNCEGCHALGKRVLATPKSSSHFVTDAPCESCHFNTSTFLGARFNHGTAKPGQCISCHNGRQAETKPASHSSGKKATESCDQCHRTSTFLPASWNHIGVVPGTCATAGCHVSGSNQYFKPANHTRTGMNTYNCDDCHGLVVWNMARYKHNRASPSGVCMGCHDGVTAVTKHAGHIATTDDCNSCHTSTVSWLGALGAKPANHIPYNAGVQCSSCHAGGTVVRGAALHAHVSPPCKTCHNSSPVYLGSMERRTIGNHEGSNASQDCISCHARQYNNWNEP